MTHFYETLTSELKDRLKDKGIGFKSLFILINNQKYDEIIKILKNDETIQTLIDNIVAERKRIATDMDAKLNDLLWLNERLIQFGEEPQPSKTKARKLLKTKVFINIYDLQAGKYENKTTKKNLRKDLKENPDARFPLKLAKSHAILSSFLISINHRLKRKKL